MAEPVSVVAVLVGFVIAFIPTLRWALAEPVSAPRVIAGYVVVTTVGVIYLLVTGVNPLSPDGTGIIAYLGSGALGPILLDSAAKAAGAIPGGGGTPPSG